MNKTQLLGLISYRMLESNNLQWSKMLAFHLHVGGVAMKLHCRCLLYYYGTA